MSQFDVPPIDPLCADPAYAEAHPDECKFFSRLIVKNEYCLAEVGDTPKFRAFVIANGMESELTEGVLWTISDSTVATINYTAVPGLTNVLAAGIVTIAAEWDGQFAFAQLEVVAECASTKFLLMIDNSGSMGQNFNGTYSTKLAYAKFLATKFVETFNQSKDEVAVGNFNIESDLNETLSIVVADLKDGINEIFGTTLKTDLFDVVHHGYETLEDEEGTRVLIILTDGQQTYGEDPRPLARKFKETGGIIVVVGIRAFGDFFQMCNEISSKGYFLSAYGSIANTVLTKLKGLKSFICSGDCPGGSVYGCLTVPLDTQVADPNPLVVHLEN